MFEKDTVHLGQRDKALHVQSQSLNAMKKIFDTENWTVGSEQCVFIIGNVFY